MRKQREEETARKKAEKQKADRLSQTTSTSSFFQKNWKWLVPVLLLPFVIWGISKVSRGSYVSKKPTAVESQRVLDSIPPNSIKKSEKGAQIDETEEPIERKTEAETSRLNLSFKWSKDQIKVTVSGGEPPYELRLEKGNKEKYKKRLSKEGQFTIKVEKAYRVDAGIYTLVLEDAKGQKKQKNITIDSPRPKVNYSTFTDSRDGQTYKTVRLKDGKVWMAENLNYNRTESWCYNNKNANCNKYGRLYTWEAARKACPTGWHLPGDDEWWNMASYYGKAYSPAKNNTGSDAGVAAYKALIAGGSNGFAALLGGFRSSGGGFINLGSNGSYWSSTDYSSSNTWNYEFRGLHSYLLRNRYTKSWAFSCRCAQD